MYDVEYKLCIDQQCGDKGHLRVVAMVVVPFATLWSWPWSYTCESAQDRLCNTRTRPPSNQWMVVVDARQQEDKYLYLIAWKTNQAHPTNLLVLKW